MEKWDKTVTDPRSHHHHNHSADVKGKKLLWVTALNLIITLAEIVGGILSNSLALLSDAFHNLGDTLALMLAWLANRFGNRKADHKKTFGYKRFEILAAFINAVLLIAICLFLLREAWERLMEPEPIKTGLMLVVATIGLIANWISVLVLRKNKKENINIKAAYLHLLGDTLSSVAVILGGIAILYFHVLWVDPLITAIVSFYIIWNTWGVLKESVDILMQTAPKGIDIQEIKMALEEVDGVENIHHLHFWRLNDDKLFFESHVELTDKLNIEEIDRLRILLEGILRNRYGIGHTTLQFEYRSCTDQLIV